MRDGGVKGWSEEKMRELVVMPACLYIGTCTCWHTNNVHIILLHTFNYFRLLRLKRRHRDIMDTLVVLVPRLISIALLLVVIYYFFAIIGIETLHDRVTEGCW